MVKRMTRGSDLPIMDKYIVDFYEKEDGEAQRRILYGV